MCGIANYEACIIRIFLPGGWMDIADWMPWDSHCIFSVLFSSSFGTESLRTVAGSWKHGTYLLCGLGVFYLLCGNQGMSAGVGFLLWLWFFCILAYGMD